jgi:16S rRNA (uracil1498-N3)-methyltransferase
VRIPRIYTAAELASGAIVALGDQAANHVARVLRMQAGQALVLFNGDGRDYQARLTQVGKRQVEAVIDGVRPAAPESPLRVTLGQVISRGDRMDYAIQKCVELGASEVVPLLSERCEVKLQGDREDKRLKRWQQVAVSAAEQSGRARITGIASIQSLESWVGSLTETATGTHKLVLHHHSEQPLAQLAKPDHLILLIGPEGGLTEAEVAAARSAGFLPTAFGGRVMRTETAPVAALAVCQWLWGDWQGSG